MQSTAERRMALLEFLCRRRTSTVAALANEFCVAQRTIRTDLEVLSCSYPIYTVKGTGGGVFVEKWFKFGMVYMTDEQTHLLRRLNENLNGNDKKIMESILKTYAKPVNAKKDIV